MDISKRIYIEEAQKKSKATVAGWVEKIKIMGNIGFITLRDRTGKLQIVAKEHLKELAKINKESCIIVSGDIKKGQLKSGDKELILKEFEIINKADPILPIEIFNETTNIDKRLDHRFLDVRNPKVMAIFKIRSKVIFLTEEYFQKNKFININTPKLTVMGVESGAELFSVDYFKKKAFLSQSPQVYKQMFVASGLERVYEIAPVFRAEKSHTTRHLTEFIGIDFEMGFIKDENDVMDVCEGLIKHLVDGVLKDCKKELELLKVDLKKVIKIPRISMKDAKKLISKKLKDDEDLDAESEKQLGEVIKKKYKSDLVFVYGYPWAVRPFYHMKEGDVTKSFDLIWNGVEITTGAQREHRLDILEKQAKEKEISLKTMGPYTEIFKFGCPMHGGAGFGADRIIETMLNLDNVREAILLPRDPERLKP
ncbi:MAG: aspartate--tRNA(Asn) ligase [Nanoarchaeota archaeon]|nr:aspartate--tRNA(Asn) ligase [Nanoarchaeota archaeon]MBU1445504.1 aspartate--tRNA(Asn) ligase [Nanoarchaeota archaeon]MBU2406419.1 aspartate--tRNA(Asn) ligase [Nanoarchaeota archaeon]MBU2420684.1 aspartate--tRNA(Asn) ligase [Nanoarchaeota archaeon]MBU2475675.1 aspartate--tRNA(Asn) ligase [Nanoarchaeota archaeon]